MVNLPLMGKKTADQSAAVYQAEYAQIIHHFSTLTQIDCEKFVKPMPTSLVHLEMVFPGKKYEMYCLKVFGIQTGGTVRTDKQLQDGWTTTQS